MHSYHWSAMAEPEVWIKDKKPNQPDLFQRSNIVASNSEHICFGPFKRCATPGIIKWHSTQNVLSIPGKIRK